MIILSNFIADLALHFIILTVLGLFMRAIYKLRTSQFIMTAFIFALIITYINHTMYPGFRISTLLKL